MKTGAKDDPAFALVLTLVTLLLLTIMAVAYLVSSSLERATARALANKTKADLAARAGVNAAIARLSESIAAYPDSATSWESVNQAAAAEAVHFQGTTLYYRDQPPDLAVPGTASPLHALPLISGAQPVLIPPTPQSAAERHDTLRAALPVLNNQNSFDLNHARSATDNQGWIGAPPGAPRRPEFRGQWIEQKDSDGRVTSRYAYWMEDDSFKVNVNLMGNTSRGSTTPGNSPVQIPLQGLLGLALPNLDAEGIAGSIVTQRARFPSSRFFEFRAVNQVGGPSGLAESIKFLATIHSGAANLSRSGMKRVNLNQVVTTSTTAAEIRKQLDQITKAISLQAPSFGQRFYRTGSDTNSLDVSDSGAPSHRAIYLNKIAANIRDYIDADSQPTIVENNASLSVRIGSPPAHAFVSNGTSGPNEVVAVGKERVPHIQEYAIRVRQVAFAPRTGPFANYTISIDHYVEFWNMSNRDILVGDLGPNPSLLIVNQPGWDAGSLDNIPDGAPRDIKLPLSAARRSDTNAPLVSFPAGSVTVLTTDPQPLSTPSPTGGIVLTPDLSRVFQIPITPDTGLRTYSGRTDKKSGSELRLNLITRTTSASDYETEIALVNDLGMLESAWGAGSLSSVISANVDNASPPENRLDNTKYHFRGGSLRGTSGATSTNATSGDPRTNAEQLRFDLNGPSANFDKTRYYSNGLNNNTAGTSSYGAPNSSYVDPALWTDYSSSAQSGSAAPAVTANISLTSIGQLGDVFDPARTRGDSNDIMLSRGGGRSLKIGQTDRAAAAPTTSGVWDGDSNSASREWVAWRLVDIFSTSDALQLDGRINANGVRRDNGAALKAALHGYIFQASPEGATGIALVPLSEIAVQELVDQLKARLVNDPTSYSSRFATTSGPLSERGELSEMPIFSSGTELASQEMSTVIDRGREELFRRVVELTTMRGNIFTVYAVGQALTPPQTGTTPNIASTTQLKVTFRIDPVWSAGTPSDPYDPSAPSAVRFGKPDKYAIKILYAGE